MTIGCSKEREDADPCAKAAENVRRLADDNPTARHKYGEDPLPIEWCRNLQASHEEVACMGYASSWPELMACSPNALRPINDVATP